MSHSPARTREHLACGGGDMCMLKCYLANNRRGHFVMADEAMSAPGIYMELHLMWLSSGAACRLFL